MLLDSLAHAVEKRIGHFLSDDAHESCRQAAEGSLGAILRNQGRKVSNAIPSRSASWCLESPLSLPHSLNRSECLKC